MIRTAEEIIEDLSYSFSTPEALDFQQSVRDKKFKKAKKMLLEYVDEDEAKLVISHFDREYNKKIALEEIDIKDVDLTDAKQKYLYSYGGAMHSGILYSYNERETGFYCNSELVPVKKIVQIWKIK